MYLRILNVSAKPTPSNYQNNVPFYFLDDPYEGELMAFFMDLFGGKIIPRKIIMIIKFSLKNGKTKMKVKKYGN
jgi:hypothetical protein